MQRNEFETMVKELLLDVTAQAMEKWTQYAQELEQDGTEKASDLYDAAYVELRLIKENQGEAVAVSLFNYGEQFVFNYFELRGAAAKLTEPACPAAQGASSAEGAAFAGAPDAFLSSEAAAGRTHCNFTGNCTDGCLR